MPGRVEADDAEPARDERLDERAELRAAPAPAVHEQDGLLAVARLETADLAPRADAEGPLAGPGEPGRLARRRGPAHRAHEEPRGEIGRRGRGEPVRRRQRRAQRDRRVRGARRSRRLAHGASSPAPDPGPGPAPDPARARSRSEASAARARRRAQVVEQPLVVVGREHDAVQLERERVDVEVGAELALLDRLARRGGQRAAPLALGGGERLAQRPGTGVELLRVGHEHAAPGSSGSASQSSQPSTSATSRRAPRGRRSAGARTRSTKRSRARRITWSCSSSFERKWA